MARNVIQESAAKWDANDNGFVRWLPTIFSAVGLVITYQVSCGIGLGFSIAGIAYGCASSNQANKVLALVFGIIGVVVSVLTMIAS